jgi:hypothetical protein
MCKSSGNVRTAQGQIIVPTSVNPVNTTVDPRLNKKVSHCGIRKVENTTVTIDTVEYVGYKVKFEKDFFEKSNCNTPLVHITTCYSNGKFYPRFTALVCIEVTHCHAIIIETYIDDYPNKDIPNFNITASQVC